MYLFEGKSNRKRPECSQFYKYWRPLLETSSAGDGDMTELREKYRVVRQESSTSRNLPSGAKGIHFKGIGEGAAIQHLTPDAADRTSLWNTITVTKVTRISVRTNTAPDLDSIIPKMRNAVPAILWVLLFNLLLLPETAPLSNTMKMLFLEKGDMINEPGKMSR